MSNYNEYILKLDTAYIMKYQIEQLSLALEHMKDEYKDWLVRNNVPMNIRKINNSSCIATEKYDAITKHEERDCYFSTTHNEEILGKDVVKWINIGKIKDSIEYGYDGREHDLEWRQTMAISRNKADELLVRMMQANRLCFLVDDMLTALLNYRTPQMDDKTSRIFLNYIRYVEGIKQTVKEEFLERKKEVLDNINKNCNA